MFINSEILQDFKADTGQFFRMIGSIHYFLNKLSFDKKSYIECQEFLRKKNY